MTGSHGVGRRFLERGNQSMRPAHVCKPPGTTDRCRAKQTLRFVRRRASTGKNPNLPHPTPKARARVRTVRPELDATKRDARGTSPDMAVECRR